MHVAAAVGTLAAGTPEARSERFARSLRALRSFASGAPLARSAPLLARCSSRFGLCFDSFRIASRYARFGRFARSLRALCSVASCPPLPRSALFARFLRALRSLARFHGKRLQNQMKRLHRNCPHVRVLEVRLCVLSWGGCAPPYSPLFHDHASDSAPPLFREHASQPVRSTTN